MSRCFSSCVILAFRARSTDTAETDRYRTDSQERILNWAIEGWKRLRERGHFVQPPAAEDAIRELEDLSSPVGAFVRDRCDLIPGARTYVDDMYAAYKDYIEGEGWHTPSTKPVFGRDLIAAVPGMQRRRNKAVGYFYEGIALKGAAWNG